MRRTVAPGRGRGGLRGWVPPRAVHDWHHVAMSDLPVGHGRPPSRGARRGARVSRLPRAPAVVERFTEAYLYESVNDVRFRGDLDAARGLCGDHVREMLRADGRQSGGLLAPAILLDALLRVREEELRAVATARGPMRRRRARDASRPADCPVCREAASVVDGALRHLVRSTEDPRWAEAVAGMEICLEHLVTMMAAPGRPSGWAAVERRQLEASPPSAVASSHTRTTRRTIGGISPPGRTGTRWTRRLGSWAVVAGRSAEAATLRSTRSVRRCGSRP